MKRKRRRVEVDLNHLDGIVESTRERPLDDKERRTLRTAIHDLASYVAARTTEKTDEVTQDGTSADPPPEKKTRKKPERGHGRNGAKDFPGAKKEAVPHQELKAGDRCPDPDCHTGRVYPKNKKDPDRVLRFYAGPPIGATVYELGSLRCTVCGTVYRPDLPEGVGSKKYDETVVSMVATLRYGSGFPFERVARLQESIGIPLPVSTQWELVEDGADVLAPVHLELMRQGAQAPVLYIDDTTMRLIEEAPRPEGEDRTGQFTTGLVAEWEAGQKAVLFVTGTRHAGENLAEFLRHRKEELESPVVMCDGLSRNRPKLGPGVEILLATCLVHGRRNFVEAYNSFPDLCDHVLEELGKVYLADREAREMRLDKHQRLAYHQAQSGPVMDGLKKWMAEQFEEKRVEPNSGAGKAMRYLQNHWQGLTLFLRHPGAPLDNNVCERALKKVVLHRKNSLFYRTPNGARVGDVFMTLIHTCALNGVNAFDYLTELQRRPDEIREQPELWMPWNYTVQLSDTRPP